MDNPEPENLKNLDQLGSKMLNFKLHLWHKLINAPNGNKKNHLLQPPPTSKYDRILPFLMRESVKSNILIEMLLKGGCDYFLLIE